MVRSVRNEDNDVKDETKSRRATFNVDLSFSLLLIFPFLFITTTIFCQRNRALIDYRKEKKISSIWGIFSLKLRDKISIFLLSSLSYSSYLLFQSVETIILSFSQGTIISLTVSIDDLFGLNVIAAT